MILLAQDLAIVPMLIVISLMGGQTIELKTILLQIGGGIAMIAFVIWLVSREQVHLPFAKRLRQDHEIQVFVALLSCFGLAFITALFQLSAALGAFIGGMLVASARETDWVQHRLEPFRTFFVAIFFVSVGMLIDVGFIVDHWMQIGLLVVAVIATNTFINAGVLRALKVPWSQSLYAGALLSQIGEFSFVLASIGYQGQIITETAYQIMVAVIAISLLLSNSWIVLMKKVLGH
jgi:CPA2 family monovalent cation:H+ antiporter-2